MDVLKINDDDDDDQPRFYNGFLALQEEYVPSLPCNILSTINFIILN